MGLCIYSSPEFDSQCNTSTTLSGGLLIITYLIFDAFTPNCQESLLDDYNLSSYQLMCGQNVFSCLLLLVPLLQKGIFTKSLEFMTEFPEFMFDCILLSLGSALGQLLLYHIIKVYGKTLVSGPFKHNYVILYLSRCSDFRNIVHHTTGSFHIDIMLHIWPYN